MLEECLLFNPFISFKYQLDHQPAVTLNEAVEYKLKPFNSTIYSNIAAYYLPEEIVQHSSGKHGKNHMRVLVNCQSDATATRPFIEVRFYKDATSILDNDILLVLQIKLIQDGIVALPTQQIVEQLLNKNWNGDHGIGIELGEFTENYFSIAETDFL